MDQVYITMSTRSLAKQSHDLLKKKKTLFQRNLKDAKIKVSEAQEPDQILWINQQEHDSYKRYRRCFLVLILVFFAVGTVAANFLLIHKQRQYEKEGNISELI